MDAAVCEGYSNRSVFTLLPPTPRRTRPEGPDHLERTLVLAHCSGMVQPCLNCQRFTPMPFKHSFVAALDQTKNQSWQNSHAWIVTPTSSHSPPLTGTVFCSGDCLFRCRHRTVLLSVHGMLNCHALSAALLPHIPLPAAICSGTICSPTRVQMSHCTSSNELMNSDRGWAANSSPWPTLHRVRHDSVNTTSYHVTTCPL